MLRTILSVAGKAGLYKLVSNGRNMLIVEALDASKKRMPVHGVDKVVSLGDIAMYTDDEEVPLWQVLDSVKAKCEGAVCAVDYKKASNEELADFFAEVLPNYDRDRVYMTHVRKLIQWYNILVEAGLTDFVPEEEKEATAE
ncbi:MAG: DUF5606 domain-containing protein [Bacteroidaceae bacterium]|nr:DUF5606 domain-containing protein [Bacteroidaceae bacterium]MBR5847434.1 DUF5606 domain-containing protein [Bacteroidaceae bacterium]